METNVLQSNSIFEFLKNEYPNAVIAKDEFESYTDFKEEYYSLKYGVGIRNLSNCINLKLSGNDTIDFLHRLSTNTVNDLTDYEKANTLFTNDKGRIIDRTTLLRLSNYCMLIGSADKDKKLKKWLERFIIMEDIVIEDLSGRYLILEILGPQANSFLTMICGSAIDELTCKKVVMEELDEVNFFLIRQKEINGCEKYWMISYSEDGNDLIKAIFNNKSAFDLMFIGNKAYDRFRIENGIPSFPNELNDSFNPHELNLLNEVDFNKGCYIGQEVIARLDTYDKVQKKLTMVSFKGEDEITLPTALFNSEREVGSLTSSSKTEDLNESIGLAVLRKESRDAGTELITENKLYDSFKVQVENFPVKK
jgi:folate-binding protein YgfZ